jgi:hypothetical protein
MESPARIPHHTVALDFASFSFTLAATTHAPSANAANGMSAIKFAERNNILGCNAHTAVSNNATASLNPRSLRRKANAASKYVTPKIRFNATAEEILAGNDGLRRHTQDNIHGYRIGYLVADGVPGTLGRM